jgi:hypothetical protein
MTTMQSLRAVILILLSMILLACAAIGGLTDQDGETEIPPEEPTSMPITSQEPRPSGWWRPSPGLTWQWQLTGELDLSLDAQVYDIDLYEPQENVKALHNLGRKVICYISVGSWEDWRPDADQFPPEVLGRDYEGWPGEKWLDIRRIDLLAPIMDARLDLCASKGFDAVEPDNIDIHTNRTGFPLSYADQLAYARWLAQEAHQRGLAIGLKNAPDQVKDLVDLYDFAITEDCFYYEWCEQMSPFIQAGKPVFAAEYTDLDGDFEVYCRRSKELGFSTILKNRDLDEFREICN